jgi:adenine deaminase
LAVSLWAGSPAETGRFAPSGPDLERLRRVAAGEEDADLVVRGGTVVAVQSRELLRRDVLIAGRYIAAVTRPGALAARRSLDATGRYVLPAYVDGRTQVERTLLAPGELARLVVPRGTVTVLTDTSAMVALAGPRGRGLTISTRTPARFVELGVVGAFDTEVLPSAARTVADLAGVGHLDADVHAAVRAGMSVVTAIRRASLVPAKLYGLDHVIGSIAPSSFADLQIVSRLGGAGPPDVVVAAGRIAAEHGRALFDNLDVAPGWALDSIRLPPGLHTGSFTSPCHRWSGGRDSSLAAVELVGSAAAAGRSPIVRVVRLEPTVLGGAVVADPSRGLLKVAVIDRAGRPGAVRVGMIRGVGLNRGAIGVTSGAAPGDLVVIGSSEDDILTAAQALEGMGGGFVAVDGGWVRAACPLPIYGMMSDAPWEAMLGQLCAIDDAAADLGCRWPSPFTMMASLGEALWTRP